MRNRQQLNADLTEAMGAVLAHRAGASYLAFVKLLDSVADQQLENLADVKPDRLLHVQGALSQLRALRNALATPGGKCSPIG